MYVSIYVYSISHINHTLILIERLTHICIYIYIYHIDMERNNGYYTLQPVGFTPNNTLYALSLITLTLLTPHQIIPVKAAHQRRKIITKMKIVMSLMKIIWNLIYQGY